ncbi:ECF transporter S component [Enemella sp. A6]|uniref:ECF transporter S component n=1 Tax=Enemella sp. A6 TaxID=3440152 RepID=UPI003EB8D53F
MKDAPHTLTPHSAVMVAISMIAALGAFAWPLIVPPSAGLQQQTLAPFMLAAILPLILAVTVSEVVNRTMDVKALALLGVLTAVGAVVRALGAGTAGIQGVFFVLVIAARVFGPGFGLVLGSTTLITSALLTAGVGPWLPYQMLASGLFAAGAGLLPRVRGWAEIAMLAGYGFIGSFIFGWLMDFAFWPLAAGYSSELSFDPAASAWQNLQTFFWFNLATSMSFNLGRAITTTVLVIVVGRPLLLMLRRAARKAWFVDAPDSSPADTPRGGFG